MAVVTLTDCGIQQIEPGDDRRGTPSGRFALVALVALVVIGSWA